MKQVDYNAIRLIRYSKLIDQAILSRRYSLATQMAYRCLLEYHRLFLRFVLPQTLIVKRNAFQLSVLTVKHLRTRQKLTVRRARQLFDMLRGTYYITHMSSTTVGDRDLHVDLATATYARDQALAISKFLFGSLSEESERASLR